MKNEFTRTSDIEWLDIRIEDPFLYAKFTDWLFDQAKITFVVPPGDSGHGLISIGLSIRDTSKVVVWLQMHGVEDTYYAS